MKNNYLKILPVLFFVILAAVLICFSKKTDKSNTDKDVFIYGTTGYGEAMGDAGLNPHDGYSGWSALRYGVCETLFKYDDDMQTIPWLAEGYEYIDESTVKINLKKDIYFSSGRYMDATAVKECFEDLLSVHDRAPYDLKIDSIEADGSVLIIKTLEPCPSIIHYLGDPYSAIIDMEYGVKGEGNCSNVAGTGPYIADFVSATEIKLSRNDNYWNGKVKIPKIVVKSFVDGGALTGALQTGDIHGAYGILADNYSLFDNNGAYNISSSPTSRCFFGQMNMESEIFRDERVRKAIIMGINKEDYCSVLLNGRGIPASGAFPSSGNPKTSITDLPYDPDLSKSLLEEAGYSDTDGDGYVDRDGVKLTVNLLTYPTRVELPIFAEYAQYKLKQIGVDAEINNTVSHRNYVSSGRFDIYITSIITQPTGDPDYFFSSMLMGSKNYGNYRNEAVEEMSKKLHVTFESDECQKLTKEIQQKIVDDGAFFFIAHSNMGIITKSDVKGMQAHACDYYEINSQLEFKK